MNRQHDPLSQAFDNTPERDALRPRWRDNVLQRLSPPARIALLMLFFFSFTGFAVEPSLQEIGELILAIILIVFFLAGLGLGLGSFGFLVNRVFPNRSRLSFKVMRVKPVLSFVVGIVVTILGFALLGMLEGADNLQLAVLLLYFVGLFMFGAGTTARLGAQFIDSTVLEDEVPCAGAHVKAGLLLLFSNALPILGTLFFLGILVTGIGASLISYFVSIGNVSASITLDEKKEKPPKLPEE